MPLDLEMCVYTAVIYFQINNLLFTGNEESNVRIGTTHQPIPRLDPTWLRLLTRFRRYREP